MSMMGSARRGACAVAAAVVLAWTLAPRAARAQTGSVSGVVVADETGAPLPYSIVSVAGRPGEQLASDAGRFEISDLTAGAVTIHVRHIGYSARDVPATVVAGETTPVTVRLVHVAVRLDAVRVQAGQSCTQPGRPRADDDSTLATVFDQVEQNAQRYLLVVRQYPFQSVVERTTFDETLRGRYVRAIDTLPGNGDDSWRYAPGQVVARRNDVRQTWGVNVPTITVFADSGFVANHCFWNAGVETLDGHRVVRVDLRVADRIDEPDFNGSLYLDSATFAVRRSLLSLSRPPGHGLNVDSMTIDTRFDEILPSLPMFADVIGRWHYTHARGDVSATVEQQHTLLVEFTGQMPPGLSPSDRRILAPPRLSADHGRLLGVFDARTGDPVPGATVVDSGEHFKGTTSRDGLLGLGKLPFGATRLMFGKPGYVPNFIDVVLSPADTTPITVVLQPVIGRPPNF
jgi:hypothetical protein